MAPQMQTVKETYYRLARELLAAAPTPLAIFERSWHDGTLREAYVLMQTTIKDMDLTCSEEYKRADESFYWLFVN